MPEYDAFGREIGENTLSGLGGESAARTPPPSETTETPEPSVTQEPRAMQSFETPEPQPAQVATRNVPVTFAPRRRRRSGGAWLVGLVIAGALAAGPVVGIVSLVDDAGDAIDDITGAIESAPGLTDEPRSAKPPTGLTGASMVAQANFRKALRRMESAGMRRASYIRLAPERLDAQVVKGSRLRNVQVRFDGGFDKGTGAAGGAPAGTVALAAIDSAAPARLVRASARRAHLKVKRIDYLVATLSAAGGLRWNAYFKNGPFAEGDASGRLVRLIRR